MLDNGKVLEMGTHEQLLKNNSHFAHFIENYFQSSNQEEDYDLPATNGPKKFGISLTLALKHD
jgi:hypothetical protein